MRMLSKSDERTVISHAPRTRMSRTLRFEWLGQTAASVFWIVSVFVYGVSSTGDWLQLGAASAWLLANIAAIASSDTD